MYINCCYIVSEKQVKKGDENNSSWLGRFNPLNYLPKGPKRGYLPDDKNPRVNTELCIILFIYCVVSL